MQRRYSPECTWLIRVADLASFVDLIRRPSNVLKISLTSSADYVHMSPERRTVSQNRTFQFDIHYSGQGEDLQANAFLSGYYLLVLCVGASAASHIVLQTDGTDVRSSDDDERICIETAKCLVEPGTARSAMAKPIVSEDLILPSPASPTFPSSSEKPAATGTRWSKGPHIATIASAVILSFNIILLIALEAKKIGGTTREGLLYDGSCSFTKNASIGLHLMINIFSTLLLAASNYCMQYLNAPTRSAIDDAHGRGKWLSIGVPSLRNIPYMGWKKLAIWMVLLVTSLPVHLLYNSVIYTSNSSPYGHSVLIAPTDFNPDIFKHNRTITNCLDEIDYMDEFRNAHFVKLTRNECMKTYSTPFLTSWGSAVVLSPEMDDSEGPLLIKDVMKFSKGHQFLNGSNHLMIQSKANQTIIDARPLTYRNQTVNASPFGEMSLARGNFLDTSECQNKYPTAKDSCKDLQHLHDIINYAPNQLGSFLGDTKAWANQSFMEHIRLKDAGEACGFDSHMDMADMDMSMPTDVKETGPYSVDGCYAMKLEEHCTLMFSMPILVAVIACGIVKVICMLYVSLLDSEDILLRMGDAVSSFLCRPDPNTEGRCMLSKDFKPNRRTPPRKLWMSAPSILRWVLTMVICAAFIIAAGAVLRVGLDYAKSGMTTVGATDMDILGTAWASVDLSLLIDPNNSGLDMSVTGSIIVTNIPQICVSISYFCFNTIITVMVCASEYSSYGVKRKILRVTNRKGAQRSTYWLSMPYQYSFSLLTIFAVLHWLVSQSIFFVLIVPYRGSTPFKDAAIQTCGFSPVAIVVTIVVSACVWLSVPVMGLRRLRSNIPLAGNCSLVFSAACHPPASDTNAAYNPVQWGECVGVPSLLRNGEAEVMEAEGDQRPHCSFTSYEVTEPHPGKEYY
ncbi:hypothetical protein KEM56_007876 [Ascosphaera pollenicola]|nr:hypothetical protein KEM56_007876 [Ascosphaera pollenicola]